MSHVSRGEWVWVLVIAAIVLLLASLPVLAGWMMSGQEREFGGFVLHLADGFSYLAKMRLGAQGAWLYSDMFAVEPHPPALISLPYLLMGKLAGPSPHAIQVTFHVSRVVFGALLLLVTYRFVALLLHQVWQRRLTWLLIAVGGGFGWLLVALTREAVPLGTPPLDLNPGEALSDMCGKRRTVPRILPPCQFPSVSPMGRSSGICSGQSLPQGCLAEEGRHGERIGI